MLIWVNSSEIAKLDQWNSLIYLYDNYFQIFLTVLRDLTAISVSSLMNNKRAYFNFKMKFAQSACSEYLLEYSIYSWCCKLHKIVKYFNCGAKFGSRSSIPIDIFIISMFDLLWEPNFIKIRHIAILRPNMPKYLISGQDPQFQISYLWLTNLTCSECQIS